jgi:raffinose/stachyose/melibiose transport system permease protein
MTAARREQLLSYAVLAVFSVVAIYPILSILLLAFHDRSDLVSGFSIPHSLDFGTFSEAWEVGSFGRGLINSFIVAASVTVVSAVLSVLAGYAFGAMRFRGSTALFYLLLVGLIFPYEATVIPLYYVFRDAGLTDTYWALILPQIGLSVPFGTFWMRAYFRSSPGSLVEASRLDGASSFATLWRVLLPPAWPAITTMLVLVFMWTWNEFLLALVMIQSDNLRTAPLGLALFAGANRGTLNITLVAAAAVLVALPVMIVYVFLQRSFIRGMFAGAVKE